MIEDEHKLYLIMQFAEGGELLQYILKQKRLPEAEASKYL